MTSQELANRIRLHALDMTNIGKSSHIGAIFSMTDIIAVLYNDIMNVDPNNPTWPDRDRFILSKGHAGAAVYAVLAEKGFFDKAILKTYYQNGSLLSGHVSHKDLPGIELSTGSLGHGLSIGTGMAFGAKMDEKDYKTYVLLSDGECNEGSTWEAVMFAAHHKLDNLVAIVDYNKLQSLAFTKDTIELEPFEEKWRSFGWEVHSIMGHNHEQLRNAFNHLEKGKPNCILAHTVKGKGVSYMENQILWHYRSPQGEEYTEAIKELKQNNAEFIHQSARRAYTTGNDSNNR